MQVNTTQNSVSFNENTCTALVPYRAPADVLRENLSRWRALPCIIYLKGTCSAGKSTFGKTFEQQAHKWVFIDDDIIAYSSFLLAIARRFPQEYVIIERVIAPSNLYHAFCRKEVLFYENADEQVRQDAMKALSTVHDMLDAPENRPWVLEVTQQVRTEVLTKIRSVFQQGKNVFLDSWFFTAAEIQERFQTTRVIRLMLYCSLPVVAERLQKRNEEGQACGNIEAKRHVKQLMSSFCDLYEVHTNPQQPIERITKTELDTQFDLMLASVKKANVTSLKKTFTQQEATVELFEKMRAEFMHPYEVANTDSLFIAPKKAQHFIVNGSFTAQKTIDSIKQIVEILL